MLCLLVNNRQSPLAKLPLRVYTGLMTAKVKSALTAAFEALEAAAGCALVAVVIYAVIFMDMTGGGSLWKSMNRIQSQERFESPNATRVIRVSARPLVEKVHEDRILAVFDAPVRDGLVSAVYQAPDEIGQRPAAAFTDSPAAQIIFGGTKGVAKSLPVIVTDLTDAARKRRR